MNKKSDLEKEIWEGWPKDIEEANIYELSQWLTDVRFLGYNDSIHYLGYGEEKIRDLHDHLISAIRVRWNSILKNSKEEAMTTVRNWQEHGSDSEEYFLRFFGYLEEVENGENQI